MRPITLASIVILFLQTPIASAADITFSDTTLGDGSFSWSDSGFTLSASASNGGVLASIDSGTFAGLWFGQSISAAGTYTFTFSQPVSRVEIEVDALSGNGGLPAESVGNFTISSGAPTLDYTNQQLTTFDGTTVFMDEDVDFGEFIMAVTGPSPFTFLSFDHAQNVGNNGSVVERVTVTPVPEPSSITIAFAVLCLVIRRRR